MINLQYAVTKCLHDWFLIVAITFQLCVVIYISSETYPSIVQYESEKFYKDAQTDKKLEFPSVRDTPSRSLSVIIPAYNEEKRCKYISNVKLADTEMLCHQFVYFWYYRK